MTWARPAAASVCSLWPEMLQPGPVAGVGAWEEKEGDEEEQVRRRKTTLETGRSGTDSDLGVPI